MVAFCVVQTVKELNFNVTAKGVSAVGLPSP